MTRYYRSIPPDSYAIHRNNIHQILLSTNDPNDLKTIISDLSGPNRGFFIEPVKDCIQDQLNSIWNYAIQNAREIIGTSIVSKHSEIYKLLFEVNKVIIREFLKSRPLPIIDKEKEQIKLIESKYTLQEFWEKVTGDRGCYDPSFIRNFYNKSKKWSFVRREGGKIFVTDPKNNFKTIRKELKNYVVSE